MKTDSSKLVEVEAPATLAEDYVFWATTTTTNDDASDTHSCASPSRSSDSSVTFPVRVPPGGVLEGETMQVLLSTALVDKYSSSSDCNNDFSSVSNYSSCHIDDDENELPPLLSQKVALRGEWKDGLCCCFRLGACHPHFWIACCCPSVLIGQIMVRMKMTWLAHRLADPNKQETIEERTTIKGVDKGSPKKSTQELCLFLVYAVVTFVLFHTMYKCGSFIYPNNGSILITNEDSDFQNNDDDNYCYYSYFWWHRLCDVGFSVVLSAWGIFVVVRLRRAIRERYEIPPQTYLVSCAFQSFSFSLGSYEDLFCACCCSCCAISQMARQTADYEGTEPASWCTLNGLRSRYASNNPPFAPNQDDSSTSTNWCFQTLRQSSSSSRDDSNRAFSSQNDMA